uniref:trypsin n=1 Tax=Mayetiola destructor TaxID=39758 RepID=Q5IY40_MAYDE|nr:trypsin precursor [Mayetiola destructor]
MFGKLYLLGLLVLVGAFYVAGNALNGYLPKPRYDGRIVGGFEMDIKDAPYQISMRVRGSHFCGGSIISKNWILTAAHCTAAIGNVASRISIYMGASSNKQGGFEHHVKRIVQHKRYNSRNIDFDFSLLELEEAVSYTDSVQAVALPDFGELTADGTNCLVSGWGNTQNNSLSRELLRGAHVPIVNQRVCDAAYEKYSGVTPRMICAGFYEEGGKDACQGDSGGPLVDVESSLDGKPILVGVVSWGYGCAQPMYPGVYSRVIAAREWIYEHTGI